jgi:hypothetical protein
VYAKIFSQIFDSSIAESPEVRFTFMDLLILADSDGVVDMTHEAIARRTNRPIDLIRETIRELEGPDKRSRTLTENGSRIKRLDDHRDWGWVIINYDTFRELGTEIQRREKTKVRTRHYRLRVRENATSVTQCDAGVTPLYPYPSPCTDQKGGTGGKPELPLDVSASRKHPPLPEVTGYCVSLGLTEQDGQYFFHHWEGNGWTNGGKPIKSWKGTIAAWKAAGHCPSQKAVQNSKPKERTIEDTLYDEALRRSKRMLANLPDLTQYEK